MTIDNPEMTINLDTKRLIAIGLLVVISIYTLYSYSIALLAFIAPDSSTPFIRVTYFNTTTTGGAESTTFSRGSSAKIKATVEKATAYYTTPPAYTSISGSTTCKITLIVYYDDSGVYKQLVFYSTTVILQPGVPYELQYGFMMPSGGPVGAHYYAKIFVWDDYLPGGGNSIIDWSNSELTTRVFSAT